jgi:ABC-type multidrug transport system ATPase subunit
VQSVCDRVGIFASGRLIGLGTVAELAARFGNDTGQVEVTFDGDQAASAKRIGAFLERIPQVASVEPASAAAEPWTLHVQPASAARKVREAVLSGAAADGLGLTAIRSADPSLDDIYRAALRDAGLHRDAATPVGAVA